MQRKAFIIALSGVLFVLVPFGAHAMIDGITGTSFALTAKEGYISGGDGQNIYMWGYANGNDIMQYPGPTLIVNKGDTVTVKLTNQLPQNVSIVFPGQGNVAARGGAPREGGASRRGRHLHLRGDE
jgi:FtsP/CotA-like multicopper oxidase with cupredoxin domain